MIQRCENNKKGYALAADNQEIINLLLQLMSQENQSIERESQIPNES